MELEDWQKQKIDFYVNSSALAFIEDFFNLGSDRAVRCIGGHIKGFSKGDQPTLRRWRNNYTECRGYSLKEEGKYKCLKDFWTNHFFIHIHDKDVLEWHPRVEKKSMFKDNVIGLQPVFELDSPYTDENMTSRKIFFDCIDEFDSAIYIVTHELEKADLNWVLEFSGNGIYVIGEAYIGNQDKERIFETNYINQIDHFNEGILGDDLHVHLDNVKANWHKYFKIPFTGHDSKNRMSIPLPKGKLDGPWIDEMSNLDNIMNDYSIIDKIIKKANWSSKVWQING